MMKDFNEVILTHKVRKGLGNAYKIAIEAENSPQWKQNPIQNKDGDLISNELKPYWNGIHAHVKVDESGEKDVLTIALISHTKPNLLGTAKWYEDMGAKLIFKTLI